MFYLKYLELLQKFYEKELEEHLEFLKKNPDYKMVYYSKLGFTI